MSRSSWATSPCRARDGGDPRVPASCPRACAPSRGRRTGGGVCRFVGAHRTVAESRGVGVRVIRDGREGLAHAGSWDPDVIDTLLAEARDNMSFAEPDDRVGLAEPDGVDAADIDPWDDRIEATSVDDKVAIAVALEAATRGADPRVRGVRTSMYADSHSESAIVSTAGIDGWDRGASASIGTQPLIDDPDGSTRTGYAGDAAAAPQLLDIEEVARLAVERGVAGMLSGELVVKGRTPFGDRVGEAIATEALTMFDDPTDPDSLSASAFDGEGLACRRVPLISEGVLQGFLHDARSARGLGVSSTGSALRSVRGTPSPGHRSLSVGPGAGDLDAFIASIDDGLLIASLQGLHSGCSAGTHSTRISRRRSMSQCTSARWSARSPTCGAMSSRT
ncbi:MAG: TldD/PmbA family protein [Actinobacteria bacterium]|nr:TldD/PmbA family protein [Actinomycetota bacterium]